MRYPLATEWSTEESGGCGCGGGSDPNNPSAFTDANTDQCEFVDCFFLQQPRSKSHGFPCGVRKKLGYGAAGVSFESSSFLDLLFAQLGALHRTDLHRPMHGIFILC